MVVFFTMLNEYAKDYLELMAIFYKQVATVY